MLLNDSINQLFRKHWLILAFTACCLLLSACGPLPPRQPEPTPIWVTVFLSPAWLPLRETVASCAPPGAVPAWVADPALAALALTWGENGPAGWAAYELGAESWVVAVHPENPAQSISLDGLRLVYSGEISDWDFLGQDPGPIAAYGLPPGEELGSLLAASGIRSGPSIQVVPGPEEMRSEVATTPGAIGLLPSRWLDESVRSIDVETPPEHLTRAPLLAYTPSEAQGLVRQWLSCLQETLRE